MGVSLKGWVVGVSLKGWVVGVSLKGVGWWVLV